MSLATLLSLALMGAAQTAAYQVTPPTAASAALTSPRPAPASYANLGDQVTTVRIADKTLMPGQLHKFGPAPRSQDFTGPFACADKKCKVRTPVHNAQTVDQREPDGRDHY